MEYKQISGREFPRFSAVKTFFRMPHVNIDSDYDVGIFGTPFDGGVSYRPGARFAPSAIREMSALGRGYHWTRGIDFTKKIKVADIGDVSVVPVSLEKTYENIEFHVMKLLKLKKRFISVGGDHSTTLPILRALKKSLSTPVNFVHFDAHLDTYPAAWDCEYHHGSFARHAVEEGLVDPKNMIQIGIRGPLAAGEDLDFVNKHGITVKTVDDVRAGSLKEFCNSLPVLKGPTYISFDIDCLDPAYAPGTGTPVPGGLTTYETQNILRSLKIDNLVGADIVEICPAYDPSQITAMAGVDTMFEMLCLMANK
ncbi:MAG: agmatinase [Bdellovibrionota bacterium]